MKNKTITKPLVFLLSILILLLISLISLHFLSPIDDTRQGFMVTVDGKVYSNSTVEKPQFVSFYWPSVIYNENRINQRASSITVQDIEWQNDYGTFSASFWLPIDMEVIVTADAGGCLHQRVELDHVNQHKTIVLRHSDDRCYASDSIPESTDQLISQTRDRLTLLGERILDVDAQSPHAGNIKQDIADGWENLREAGNAGTQNKSEEFTLRAYFHTERAFLDEELFKLSKCVNKSLPLVLFNDTCSILPYPDKQAIEHSNRSYYYHWEDRSTDPEYNAPAEQLRREIGHVKTDRHQLQDDLRHCEDSYQVTINSLNDQENVCKARRFTLWTIKWSEKLIWLCLGIILCLLTFVPSRKWIEK